ncbi:MAG: hypothetical protein JWN48_4313 [Myxococcaceae bacterium]|nr:hypothetical protein [Myxococcaceae bacterium]
MREARTWHDRCAALLTRLPLGRPVWPLLVGVLLVCSACAEIPKGRYGIERLKFHGMKELDHEALRSCLVTEQREKVTLGIGALISPTCGEPPFDKKRASLRLFATAWTNWPAYDEAIFKLDLERLERWYQARGFYGVRVLDVKFKPEQARVADTCEGPKCKVEIEVDIDEGEPVLIRKLIINVAGQPTPEMRLMIDKALLFKKGDRFDEADYDRARDALAKVLREKGYARAKTTGEVVINRGLLVADIIFNVETGPLCHFGDVRVETKGDDTVPKAPILESTLLRKGQLYTDSAIEDAQRSVYALGAFSAVTVRGEVDETTGSEIPVVIEVEPRRKSLYLVGAGILSGVAQSGQTAQENISIPQWDVHLLASYENRNFFGGLRRFRIEERPRLLFLAPFPGVPGNSPRFGNTITARFTQPGVGDPRTNLFVEAHWDNGPDPFLLFFRNDVGAAVGLERGFFKQRLSVRIALHQDIMQVSRRQPITESIQKTLNNRFEKQLAEPRKTNPNASITLNDQQTIFYDVPSSYRLPFAEQKVTLDLRDDAANPTKGFFFTMTAHEAVKLENLGWNYLRVTPDARGYVPMGLGIVLAARFALGWLEVLKASKDLDYQAKILGAQAYRLRGGGANSNRGFAAGRLGDGLTGGTHRWEGSLELRVPLTKSLFIVGFGDMGDVNAGFDVVRTYPDVKNPTIVRRYSGFRFDHLNTAVGGGLRYHTPIGPVRLDVAGRPQKLGWNSNDDTRMDLGFTKFRGAVQISIGEAF